MKNGVLKFEETDTAYRPDAFRSPADALADARFRGALRAHAEHTQPQRRTSRLAEARSPPAPQAVFNDCIEPIDAATKDMKTSS